MMRPLGDRLVVRIDESLSPLIHIAPVTDKWRGKAGIIEGWNLGTVIRVGPGKPHPKTGKVDALTVKAGDVVRFSELEYSSELVEGQRHVLIQEGDILGIEE